MIMMQDQALVCGVVVFLLFLLTYIADSYENDGTQAYREHSFSHDFSTDDALYSRSRSQRGNLANRNTSATWRGAEDAYGPPRLPSTDSVGDSGHSSSIPRQVHPEDDRRYPDEAHIINSGVQGASKRRETVSLL